MTAPTREIDEDVARLAHAAYQAKCRKLTNDGQRLLARIRPTSKYFGQGDEGKLFPVAVAPDPVGYTVVGGPGGRYRLADVELFAIFDEVKPIQITFDQSGS